MDSLRCQKRFRKYFVGSKELPKVVGQGEEVLCVLKDPLRCRTPGAPCGPERGPRTVVVRPGSGRGCGRAEFQPIADLFGPGSVPYLHVFFLT